ncbi:MAG: hypothetical protein US50_C0007G0010 [Candidatus Nomurabacteria bacterium GW2011_GWB1_37_5]|uniref:Uncharacterized protein n=1 Tax=Candidatus Nomurabacteria bacterium GW2011_GWB1_37_5 TaxID=1618742 RepID=A0A0G0H0K7_9BACT|nr:MAG: hypothetical protein US50_C0007G0010 [Candidatus Nomurabacteria bacterium GW2011_GWB1_37_5]
MRNKKIIWKSGKVAILGLFLMSSFFLFQKNVSAADCTIDSATFNPSGLQSQIKESKSNVFVDIGTTGCENRKIYLELWEIDPTYNNVADIIQTTGSSSAQTEIHLSATENGAKINLLAGDDECDPSGNPDCQYYLVVKNDTKSQEINTKTGPNQNNLFFNYSNIGDDDWKILDIYSGQPGTLDANRQHLAENVQAKKDMNDELATPDCGLTKLTGCVAFFFVLVNQVTMLLAKVAAHLLDFLIGYSLSSVSYKAEFITQGWTVTRDIANIAFIFILLFVAIKTIIEGGTATMKKLLVNILLAAIFINFSLFMVRAIIDATNILARIFYNNIEVVGTVPGAPTETKSITIALVNNFSPQRMLLDEYGVKRFDPDDNLGKYILMVLLMIYVNITMFTVFLSVGIYFLTRVIQLWIAMIFAPFAFLSLALPEKTRSKLADLGWDKWFKNMTEVAFMAPIFIFFLYLIILFIKVKDLIPIPSNTENEAVLIMAIIIPFLIIIGLLKKAQELTKQFAGTMADQLIGGVKGLVAGAGAVAAFTPVGRIAGLAGGALAKAGRETIGKAGTKLMDSNKLAEIGKKGGIVGSFAKGAIGLGKSAATASYDIRALPQTKLGAAMTGQLTKGLAAAGIGLEALPGQVFAGAGKGIMGRGEQFKGGYLEDVNRKQKRTKEEMDSLHTNMNDRETQEWSKKQGDEYNQKREKSQRDNFVKEGIKNKSYKDEAEAQSFYDAYKATPAGQKETEKYNRQYEKKEGPPPKQYNTAAELNADRDKTYLTSKIASETVIPILGPILHNIPWVGKALEKTGMRDYIKSTGMDNEETKDWSRTRRAKWEKDFKKKRNEDYEQEIEKKAQDPANSGKTRDDLRKEYSQTNFERDKNYRTEFEKKNGPAPEIYKTVDAYLKAIKDGTEKRKPEGFIKNLGYSVIGAHAETEANRKLVDAITKEATGVTKTAAKLDALNKQLAATVLGKKIEDVTDIDVKMLHTDRDDTKEKFDTKLKDTEKEFRKTELKEKGAADDFSKGLITSAAYDAIYDDFRKAKGENEKLKNLWENKEKAEEKLGKAGYIAPKETK